MTDNDGNVRFRANIAFDMSGFLGMGGSASKTDRGNILSGLQSQWDVYGRGLGLSGQQNATGQQQRAQGTQNLTSATDYWNRLLTAGRTQTAQNSAPAINAQLAQTDAQRNQQAQFGSGRSGGTAAGSQTAATNSQANIDNIINQNLVGGRQAAASGLAGVGSTQLNAGSASMAQALQALGLSGEAGNNVAKIAANQYPIDYANEEKTGQSAGQAAAMLALAFL